MWSNRPGYHTRIKLCEFEWLDPAYEAARLGADLLGFHVFRHHQDIAERVRRFAEIFGYLPAGADKVLLSDLRFGDMVEVVRRLQADTVQLYPDWAADAVVQFRAAVGRPLRILKVMSAQPAENFDGDDAFLDRYRPCVDGFLLDSARQGGTGRKADWDHCADIVLRAGRPVFLAGGLTAANVAQAIRQVRPYGVDVETGVSDRLADGRLVKNMHKCGEFVNAVLEADRWLVISGATSTGESS